MSTNRRRFLIGSGLTGFGLAGAGKLLADQFNPSIDGANAVPSDKVPTVAIPTTKLLQRFAVIADTGAGRDIKIDRYETKQYAIADAMTRYHQKNPFNTVLMVGDNIYNKGEISKIHVYKIDAAMKADVAPILKKHKVRLWINGHDHNYQRSKPIDGTTYLVCGGGGANLYPVKPQSWTAFAKSVHSFGIVEVYQDQIMLTGIDSQGEIIDRGFVTLT